MTAVPQPSPTQTPTHAPWVRQQRRRVFWPVVGMVVASICLLVVVGLTTGELGTDAVITAVVLALVPVVVVVATFLWLDRWEPEPGRTLLFAFLWGGGVATLGALFVNSFVDLSYGQAASAVVSAPLVEEGLKGVFLVGLLWLHRRELDGVLDGVVYAGVVAAGFAFVENILYLGNAFDANHPDGYLVFVMRGVLSPFAHPLFTVFIGLAVGIAVRRSSAAARVLLPLLGYLLAVAVHAVWNASTLWDGGRGFLPTYITVMVPIFLSAAALALWQRRRERRLVAHYVPAFAREGWIAESEVPLLSSMAGRRRWRRAAKAYSGAPAGRAVRDYQTAVTELAFLADRIARGATGPDTAQLHAELLATVGESRARAVAAAEAATR